MNIEKETLIGKSVITWYHQVSVGSNCVLECNIYFKFDGILSNGPSIKVGNNVFIGRSCEFNIRKGVSIGDYANIASGCKFIDHDHGIKSGSLIGPQEGNSADIEIGRDVWLGSNVIVLKGVKIGEGAVVGAGAVVTKSIPINEIWAGVPARKIGERSAF